MNIEVRKDPLWTNCCVVVVAGEISTHFEGIDGVYIGGIKNDLQSISLCYGPDIHGKILVPENKGAELITTFQTLGIYMEGHLHTRAVSTGSADNDGHR